MLALLIKVVREMVFTLGIWSFSNKPGKFTSYNSQGSNQRLGQQVQGWIHSILVTEGQQEVCVLNLLHGAPSKADSWTWARTTIALCARPREGTRENRFSSGLRSQALGRNSGNTLALNEKDACDVWQPLQIWNNVNDFSELLVQLHWVIWNLWFMN